MSEVKKTNHSADVLASIKSQVPTVVDKYLGTKFDDVSLRFLNVYCRFIEKILCAALPRGPSRYTDLKRVQREIIRMSKGNKLVKQDFNVTSSNTKGFLGQQREEEPNLAAFLGSSALRNMITNVQRNHESDMHLLLYTIQPLTSTGWQIALTQEMSSMLNLKPSPHKEDSLHLLGFLLSPQSSLEPQDEGTGSKPGVPDVGIANS
ncbi:hypothetical protein Tco_0503679 [Tanacetum coccineum]